MYNVKKLEYTSIPEMLSFLQSKSDASAVKFCCLPNFWESIFSEIAKRESIDFNTEQFTCVASESNEQYYAITYYFPTPKNAGDPIVGVAFVNKESYGYLYFTLNQGEDANKWFIELWDEDKKIPMNLGEFEGKVKKDASFRPILDVQFKSNIAHYFKDLAGEDVGVTGYDHYVSLYTSMGMI